MSTSIGCLRRANAGSGASPESEPDSRQANPKNVCCFCKQAGRPGCQHALPLLSKNAAAGVAARGLAAGGFAHFAPFPQPACSAVRTDCRQSDAGICKSHVAIREFAPAMNANLQTRLRKMRPAASCPDFLLYSAQESCQAESCASRRAWHLCRKAQRQKKDPMLSGSKARRAGNASKARLREHSTVGILRQPCCEQICANMPSHALRLPQIARVQEMRASGARPRTGGRTSDDLAMQTQLRRTRRISASVCAFMQTSIS